MTGTVASATEPLPNATAMAAIQQTLRDNALYFWGYLQGRSFSLPRSFSALYGVLVSRVTSFVSLPLPLLSFLALPVFGGTSTSVNLFLFYLTWSSLVLTHDPLSLEIYGTLAIRLLFFLLPALGLLSFDVLMPSLSKGIKASGEKHLPGKRSHDQLVKIAGVATFNVVLAVALQAALEVFATQFLHLRSILKVTTTVPLPWNIAKDVLKGLALRGILHYTSHRYVLHTYDTQLKSWHLDWQHSIRLPFSLVAAYDHPVCYLIARWMPTFVPAYLFRFHVLTWHIFVALTSLEELFIYSGYAVLPSSIILAGMARRTDAHFATASQKDASNFGNTGLLDLVCGTNCKDAASVLDDLRDEAQNHRIEERASKAARGAVEGLQNERLQRGSTAERDDTKQDDVAAGEDPEDQEYLPDDQGDARRGADESADTPEKSPAKRRSSRNLLRKT